MLKEINEYQFPQDLKGMSEKELGLLSYKIREFLVDKVSATGGHLASNLGIVDLTIALHSVFDSPKDKIVWDVGHQSYVHKILTGRAEGFNTLRQFEGMSGFPKRGESPHDVFDSGHSSNSISIGLGLARARDFKGEDFSVISVIGDGALTGGIAYEALNNAGNSDTKLLVILNDNQMSISKNIGSVSTHLGKLRVAPAYKEFKNVVRKAVTAIPLVGTSLFHGLEHVRDTVKYALVHGSMFEELGFNYYGPVDGHNIEEMIHILQLIKDDDEPTLLHVITKKGKGISKAEKNPGKFHGVGPFDASTFESSEESKTGVLSYSQIAGNTITNLASSDPRIVAISAAMVDGTGLTPMMTKFPHRIFDVGIAEQHAVSFASGLALDGMKPFVVIYSTFLQRAYDEIMMDVCLQNIPVVFCIDRGGCVGADGETHHGIYDFSYLLPAPNLTIMAPKDGKELSVMLEYAQKLTNPCAIRYPRGNGEDFQTDYTIDGKAEVLKQGKDICIIAIGKMVKNAWDATLLLEEKGLRPTLINARFAKPLDEQTLLEYGLKSKLIVTIEDNTLIGGFGAMVSQVFIKEKNEKQANIPSIQMIGWPDSFIAHGSVSQLEQRHGLDPQGIANTIEKSYQNKKGFFRR